MRLFDLHCDTLYEIYKKKESLEHNDCHISLDKAKELDEYIQVTAIWSEHRLAEDEVFNQYCAIVDYSKEQSVTTGNFKNILAIEGGEVIGDDIKRLDRFYKDGVRILTPVWKDENRLGGAFNTDKGLTEFGKEVALRCFELGIILDVSHSSDALFYDLASLAEKQGKPIIASHSCSRAVCDHKRNLTDEMAKEVKKLGGVVGINLVPEHLGGNSFKKAIEHMEHFASVIGWDSVCLGCDFDGTNLPEDIENLSSMPYMYRMLCENIYDERIADGVFYLNARNFFDRWNIL